MKKILLLLVLFVSIIDTKAQFNTIQKQTKTGYVILNKVRDKTEDLKKEETGIYTDTIVPDKKEEFRLARNKPPRTKGNKTVKYSYNASFRLQGLSIKNLYKEILDNGIKHPKIVLAQAILETGWFKSSVCHNKGNLFGLTNPRTGQYYEFDHWKESVKAYKDKVQYKYKGGNYLLWLREIGYAEVPRYVSSLVKILEQYFL